MMTEPQKEHQWLQQFVGEWTYEGECPGEGPDKPPTKMSGGEKVRSIGGLWIQAEGTGKMPDGAPATTILTLGFDAEKKRYVGTWIGSMMGFMWHYDGSVDAGGRILTLDCEGPSMAGDGSKAKYQDIHECRSKDERGFSSRMQGPDGKWTTFVTMTYRRKPS